MRRLSLSPIILLIALTACVPAVTTAPTATPTVAETPPPAPTPTSTPTPPPPSPTAQPDQIRHVPSPDGRWTALVNETAGSLVLEGSEGESVPIFPPGSTVATVEWSPDSRHLLIERTNRLPPKDHVPQASGPPETWSVRITGDSVEPAMPVLQPPELGEERDAGAVSEIVFGRWAPDGRRILVWRGPGASIRADGNEPWVLDVSTGEAIRLAEWALVNPRYYSWAPDSSALAITAGGYRSAQVNKWLNLFDAASGQVTTVVSQTEQVPGIVAWSPRGDLVAYAAVPASETGRDLADWMVFENPAIAGRRVYLLDPSTGEHRRLNQVDAFQDAPTWSDDGEVLYYVQREDDTMALMAADPATSQAQVVPGARRPAPKAVGYYGQSDWDDLLAHRPDAPGVSVPPPSETYTDPTHGYTLRYPAGWEVRDGWRSVHGWHETPTLSPPGEVPQSGFGPFSGQALIAIRVVEVPEGGMDALLKEVLAAPGPSQIVEEGSALTPFDRRELTVAGRPAVRLETMGDFGEVNHVLVVMDATRGLVLRGLGDGRVFDAVVESLQLKQE